MNLDDLLFIAVGGGAASIARSVIANASAPMRALILDTDDAILQTLPPTAGVSTTIFGTKRLSGRGTGGDTHLGAGALRDDAQMVMSQIGTPRLAVLLTCCGGGTSKATELLLEMLRTQGIATITFATEPFDFEGSDRKTSAKNLLETLALASDAFTKIRLSTLVTPEESALPLEQLFEKVAQRIAAGTNLFWSLLANPGFLSFDAEHFHRMLTQSALSGMRFTFSTATEEGPERAKKALETLIASPAFQENGIDRLRCAAQIIVGILAGSDLRLCELSQVMDGLREHCSALKESFLGTSLEPAREGAFSVVVMAFGAAPVEAGKRPDPLAQVGHKGRNRKSKTPQLGGGTDRFGDVERTLYNGQDLDEPTYLRRNIRLTR